MSKYWLKSQQNASQGFSLLETIIASMIFSAILILASSAFRFFTQNADRAVSSKQVMSDAMLAIDVRNSIKDIQYYFLPPQGKSHLPAELFFHGEPNWFTGISTSALNASASPSQISLFTKSEGEDKKLYYCEHSMKLSYPTMLATKDCDSPILMADEIDTINFSYYGWRGINSLYSTPGNNVALKDKKTWRDKWVAKELGVIPQYIRIELSYKPAARLYLPTELWFKLAEADPVHLGESRADSEV